MDENKNNTNTPYQTPAGDTSRRLLMLAGHYPDADPRVSWEIESAIKNYDVEIWGFKHAKKEGRETRSGAPVVLLTWQRMIIAILTFPMHVFFEMARSNRLGASERLKYSLLSIAYLPIFVFVWIIKWGHFLITHGASFMVHKPKKAILHIYCFVMHRAIRPLRRKIFGDRPGELDAAENIEKTTQALANLGETNAKVTPLVVIRWMNKTFATSALLFKHWRKHRESFDVVHCNDLDTLAFGVVMKKLVGARLVYDAHEFYPFSFPSMPGWGEKMLSVWEKRLIRNADSVITVSPPIAEAIAQYYSLASIEVIPNASPLLQDDGEVPETDMSLIAKDRAKFLYQGNFAAGRGIQELIQAWQGIDAAEAVLFLRGPDNHVVAECRELARKFGLLDTSVYFLPPVAPDQLIKSAREADVGIISYRPISINNKLACPNKLGEYMQAGIAILSNKLVFVEKTLTEAASGIVYDSTNPQTFVDSANRLITDTDWRASLGKNGRHYALSHYHWEKFEHVLLRCYSS